MMTRKVAEAVEAGACVISKIDPEANTITALAQYIFRYPGNPSHTWRQLNQPLRLTKDPVGQQVFKTGRPVVGRVNGVKKNSAPPAWSLPAPSTQKPGWGLVFALPLEIDRRVIGLLEIYHKNPQHELSTEAVQLCRVLATQTTMAMEQARLFEETRQRLSEVSTLYTLAQEISGKLDLQTVLDTIVVSLRQAMGCRGCCIFLLDETGQQLEIKAADGLKPHWRQRARLKLGEGIAGRVAADGRPVYVPDTRQDSGFVVFDEDVRSLLVIPLLAYGEVIGTINVDDDRADAFDRTQERLLTIAAAQAGIVIANARLFAQISAEQQQTRAIIQFMADGLLLINSQGIIITCNQTLAQMLGLHSGQIVGQKVGAPDIHPSLAQITAAATRVARTGVLATDVVLQAPHPKTLRVFATTVVDENHRPLGEVRVVHDVTRDREMEQLKDDFFSTMSHELRTPLFSIQGFAQILLEEGSLDGATRTEFLSTIQRQAKQLSEMVNNLLDFSKFEQGKLELDRLPVNLADLIHQTILKLQGYAHQERVKLVSKVSPTLPAVPADGQRLEQVLTNLIGNAIKFSHPGDEVRVSAVVTGKTVKVAVRDQGIGIPPHDLEQIFQPYYQADRQGERSAMGSGLGLHIAKKIIKAHHGHIWVESKAGQGSTFYFTLPL
jgi:PAS domain S-box-containing protein